MAQLRDRKITLRVKLINGLNANGKPKYKTLSFKDINPAITEEQLLELGARLAGLQELELSDIYKSQVEKVVQA
ncbi:DUF1659 domain-containing protein [Peptostreptococcus sp. D1]|uniref:DUF1659 domain-containing protein n=1 Tax=Peptostreptococcus sp. D1 TaxID=72304 RepID=UPI0008F067BB|nr:DUF1659 domain-containing protein [Peptostreptococcus sp. D1]SFE86389.1 Protein of unknown function [Peptostreptococcus sp. D1]